MRLGNRLSVQVENSPKPGYLKSGLTVNLWHGSTQLVVSLTVHPRPEKSSPAKKTYYLSCNTCGRNFAYSSAASLSTLSGLVSESVICEACGGKSTLSLSTNPGESQPGTLPPFSETRRRRSRF